MSRFYVGQRVRLARPHSMENFGLTGRIEHFDFAPKGTPTDTGDLPTDCDCGVTWDCEAEDGWCWQCLDQLEPIIPDGYKLAEWSECLWQPDHLKEGVK